jgi:hypothetical protein
LQKFDASWKHPISPEKKKFKRPFELEEIKEDDEISLWLNFIKELEIFTRKDNFEREIANCNRSDSLGGLDENFDALFNKIVNIPLSRRKLGNHTGVCNVNTQTFEGLLS